MTTQEAINFFKVFLAGLDFNDPVRSNDYSKSSELAIKALEVYDEYVALKKRDELAQPTDVEHVYVESVYDDYYARCPICGVTVQCSAVWGDQDEKYSADEYCPSCGKHLDWSFINDGTRSD